MPGIKNRVGEVGKGRGVKEGRKVIKGQPKDPMVMKSSVS